MIACSIGIDVLVTGSWDSTIRVWDPYVPSPPNELHRPDIRILRSAEVPLRSTHTLPARVYNLSYASSTSTLLISMAHRHVSVYSLASLASALEGQVLKPEQQRESALKFSTRAVACMVDGKGQSVRTCQCFDMLNPGSGWASGSIEGRIAVEYFDADPAAQSQKYAFRAHRQTVDGVDCVYPINALAYHPM